MLRDLQSFEVNVNAQCKATTAVKRGTFVQINEVTKVFGLPTQIIDLFIADKDMEVTKSTAMGEPYSEYDADQELIKVGEFAGLIAVQKGVRKATSEYVITDALGVADAYLTVGTEVGVNAGKLITSATATNIKSLGFITDNFQKLLGFRIV